MSQKMKQRRCAGILINWRCEIVNPDSVWQNTGMIGCSCGHSGAMWFLLRSIKDGKSDISWWLSAKPCSKCATKSETLLLEL